jgi:hypothetical protein
MQELNRIILNVLDAEVLQPQIAGNEITVRRGELRLECIRKYISNIAHNAISSYDNPPICPERCERVTHREISWEERAQADVQNLAKMLAEKSTAWWKGIEVDGIRDEELFILLTQPDAFLRVLNLGNEAVRKSCVGRILSYKSAAISKFFVAIEKLSKEQLLSVLPDGWIGKVFKKFSSALLAVGQTSNGANIAPLWWELENAQINVMQVLNCARKMFLLGTIPPGENFWTIADVVTCKREDLGSGSSDRCSNDEMWERIGAMQEDVARFVGIPVIGFSIMQNT